MPIEKRKYYYAYHRDMWKEFDKEQRAKIELENNPALKEDRRKYPVDPDTGKLTGVKNWYDR